LGTKRGRADCAFLLDEEKEGEDQKKESPLGKKRFLRTRDGKGKKKHWEEREFCEVRLKRRPAQTVRKPRADLGGEK